MKIFLISHIADLDGVMPVVLTDLTFDDYDYELLEIKEVNDFMKESLSNNRFDEYDKVLMTDLCINDEVAKLIDNIEFKNKFQVLDHHYINKHLNKYSFIKVVDEVNGIKESGTSLYYQYLIEHYPNELLKRKSVIEMVSLVTMADTWQNIIQSARDLATILFYYGNERFISNYKNFLRKNNEFYFNEAENVLLEVDRNHREEYIENAKNNMIIKSINGYNVGIVFAENYRSELGNRLAQEFIDTIDLVMIINMNRSLSFRAVKDNINVCEFATMFGGKGHKLASGAPLPENIKEETIQYLLKENNICI